MSTGERERDHEHRSPIAEEVFSGQHRFDLTDPPSRAEVGLPDARSDITYQRPEPFFVRVALPEGHELALDARLVGFDSRSSPDPVTGPPTTLDVHHYAETLAAGRDHLLAAAGQFGLDRQAIEDWYRRAGGPRSAPGPPTVRSRWLSTDVGYLQLQVRASYRPPVDAADPARVLVHYALAWGGAPAAPPS